MTTKVIPIPNYNVLGLFRRDSVGDFWEDATSPDSMPWIVVIARYPGRHDLLASIDGENWVQADNRVHRNFPTGMIRSSIIDIIRVKPIEYGYKLTAEYPGLAEALDEWRKSQGI